MIKNFDEYINESGFNPSASWGVSPLSSVDARGSIEPYDPSLSFSPFDIHQNRVIDQINRATKIITNVMPNISSKSLEFDYTITDLYIIKQTYNNNGLLDIYIKYKYDDETYYGVFRNFGGMREYTFTSTIININEFSYNQRKFIKLKEIILNEIMKWYKPYNNFNYRLLKDLELINDMGDYIKLPKGAEITVIYTTDINKPYILLSYNNCQYKITDLKYYFFNWLFKPIEKSKFYM